MGVPAFFRWLSQKYPKITSPVQEERPREINGITIPVDASKPNPNGEEFDNLYLDMNGIIHPCCHPEDKPAPTTEDEMFVEIFKYIDRIMGMMRPRKVLYMAIDGVAPRAKMNQQRSRRFRAAQEAQIEIDEEAKVRREWEAAGDHMPSKVKKEHFDSNCITPGTPFMANLAVALRYYVAERLHSDPAWQNLKVVLSDASIPGEGEHKIMDYIRRQRNQPGYDANTRHVLYGLDADLIMLALATHEPYFKILREDVFAKDNNNKGCFICGQQGHMASQCTGKKKEKNGEFDEKSKGTPLSEKPFLLLHVNILREYLEIELKTLDLPFAWSTERAIDDWVFLCFFVGNDFLPHLPSLEIREGAIDKLIALWKKNLSLWGGYLTDSGSIDMKHVQAVMADLGTVEDEIFRERKAIEQRKKDSQNRRQREQKEREMAKQHRTAAPTDVQYGIVIENQVEHFMQPLPARPPPMVPQQRQVRVVPLIPTHDVNKAAAEALKQSLRAGLGLPEVPGETPHGVKRKEPEDAETADMTAEAIPIPPDAVEVISDGEEEVEDEEAAKEDETEIEDVMTVADVPIPHKVSAKAVANKKAEEEEEFDDVRLHESGWKQRYYQTKFRVEATDINFRRGVVTSYVEGLCWVLKYYYQGCQSWNWYFPYHYAPFASDFDFIGELQITFDRGTPFRPAEQLMGVLPAFSKQHIPEAFRSLMTDPESPIIDFYPERFPIDLNGKKYAWQGVAILPFIDEKRLKDALDTKYDQLTEEEVKRNSLGDEILIVGGVNPLYESFCALFGRQDEQKAIPIDPGLGSKFFGAVLPDPEAVLPGSTFESPLTEYGLRDIENCHSISVRYFMPPVGENHIFKADLLPSVKLPAPVLDSDDAYHVRAGGSARRGRGRGGGFGGRGGAADRFVRHGVGRQEGANANYGRQYDSRHRGYDQMTAMEQGQHEPKRPRFDDRQSQNGPYMGGGGYARFNSGGGYDAGSGGGGGGQYAGGGYVPNANYGQQGHAYQGGGGYYNNNQQGGYQSTSSYQQAYYPQQQQGGYQPAQSYGGGGGYQYQQQQQQQQYQSPASGGVRPSGNLGWSRNVGRGSSGGGGSGQQPPPQPPQRGGRGGSRR
ncbi:5'-3' exoribonuclease 2 [Geranomyces variabilis]|nr:5'-3' exoribonuclease 2 [Geranomyces variabilis]